MRSLTFLVLVLSSFASSSLWAWDKVPGLKERQRISKEITSHDRRQQSEVYRDLYESKPQAAQEARRELGLEMRNLLDHSKRLPASK